MQSAVQALTTAVLRVTPAMLRKVSARGTKSMPQNEIGSANVIVCPGGEEQCPPGHSCCSVPGTDLFHCCPGGYSCEEGLCRETSAAMFSTSETKVVTGLLTGCGKK